MGTLLAEMQRAAKPRRGRVWVAAGAALGLGLGLLATARVTDADADACEEWPTNSR